MYIWQRMEEHDKDLLGKKIESCRRVVVSNNYINEYKKHHQGIMGLKKVDNEYEAYKLNITAVYTVNQVKKILKSINKESKTIISIFSGRMGDVGKDPIPIIKESVRLAKRFRNVQILWTSTREAYNYLQAKNCGCSIITMPSTIIKKILKFGKRYQELTLDTVKI